MQSIANVTDRTTEWHSINWMKTNRAVRGLRRRIFKATSEGNWRKVRSLQKLMLNSYSNRVVSIRRVTQNNKGKDTPGVDRVLVKTPLARGKMVDELKYNQHWKPKPAKRVSIPKANGKIRPLGIPTIHDRCLQAIVKNALEPCWEAQFEGISYGFRPGRSTHDAIGKIYCAVRPNNKKKWILDADIKGCFDNISHDKLLDTIGNFPGRKIIKAWLKAGYINEENKLCKPNKGTPQGGIISPLLANIALHGMEKVLGVKYNCLGESRGKRIVVRYADDFVCLCETKEDAEIAQFEVERWLHYRGLELSMDKTKIVHITEGFDFLGFTIRQFKVKNTKTGYKLLIKPSKEKLKEARKEIREIFLKYNGCHVGLLISKINPVIRGKANYWNKAASSVEFSKMDSYLFTRQVRYVKRTHPNKGKKWTQKRYWGRLNLNREDNWVFGDKRTGNYMLKFSWTKINRHALVRKRSSPDDPSLKEYWEKRYKKSDQSESYKLNAKRKRVAERQNYRCPVCGESIFNDEPVHLHHITPRSKGGEDSVNNLVLLHQFCHHKTHYLK